MKCSVILRIVPLMISVAIAVVGTCGSVSAADGFLGGSGSLVVGLTDASDLQPLMAAKSSTISRVRPTAAAMPVASNSRARQSVPASDRAASYGGDLFRNSKVVLPLLVADLSPKTIATARPMSGRSVGARPSAPWTQSSIAPAAPQVAPGRESSVSWSSYSHR